MSAVRKGDSLRIRATSTRNTAPDIRVNAGAAGHVAQTDSTASRAGASPSPCPQPRGQPSGGGTMPWLFMGIGILIIGYITYVIIKSKKQ
ncbi:MAG: hypothetical protein IJQ13_00170 [Prevotella sp.]|nr:hypothetical protein [Prevotella sp.]